VQRSVVVIGNFDGVHSGHLEVVRTALAAASGRPLVVLTFWPHPVHVLRPDIAPKLLTTLNHRIDLLKQAGASEVRVVPFTPDVSNWTPREFVEKMLLPLRPELVVVGQNFRFGHGAAGNVATLAEIGASQPPATRFSVQTLDLTAIGERTTSSSAIRALLDAGDVETAARHLGRNFRVKGLVVMGDQRGRQLGFPTANLPVPFEQQVPADGVYAGWLTRLDEPDAVAMPAAISVGTNPTFEGHERRVESYVLDRDDLELYGVRVAVDFVARLRGQVRYTDVDALISQIQDDVAACRRALGLN